jgi:hypothetical protein
VSRYAKSVAALLGAISTWGITAAAEGGVNAVEWFGLLGSVGTVIGVYAIPNTPPGGQPSDPAMSEQDPQLKGA